MVRKTGIPALGAFAGTRRRFAWCFFVAAIGPEPTPVARAPDEMQMKKRYLVVQNNELDISQPQCGSRGERLW